MNINFDIFSFRNAHADALESQGVFAWLTTLFPFVFAGDFSDDHRRYWNHKWDVFQRLKRGERVSPDELVTLIILGRGMGKSTMAEVAALMRAAILSEGYLLYVCATDDQAREHIGNIKFLIEHPDSRLAEFYPALGEPKQQQGGNADTWNKDTFITASGAIFRAKGLQSSMRGLRVGTLRPNHIILDDIDDISDSVMVANNKLAIIKSSILPVAADNATIDFPQNLITEHSVLNQIHTGKTDALSERTTIGVTKAFTSLDIDSRIDETTGRLRHTILPTSVPSWIGFDIPKAQKFLNASGLDTFLAEYQNEIDRHKSGKVIPEYNEATQIISWSAFEEIFGVREIPRNWKIKVGLDVGYTDGQYPHYSAWVFVATSAMNTPLPNKVFVFKSRFFLNTLIDVQAETIKAELGSLVRHIATWDLSHEKTGEMLTLRQKHNLPFQKFTHYRAEDGVAQWRHLSRVDRTTPNPFRYDDKNDDGLYQYGSPELFYVVDDDQELVARDDGGQRLLREQISTWNYVPVKLTASGQTVQKPSKINDDGCDALKSVLALFGPMATPKTPAERFDDKMKDMGLDYDAILAIDDERERIATAERRAIENAAFAKKRAESKRGAGRPTSVANPFRR